MDNQALQRRPALMPSLTFWLIKIIDLFMLKVVQTISDDHGANFDMTVFNTGGHLWGVLTERTSVEEMCLDVGE
jgi:hypothetical protein